MSTPTTTSDTSANSMETPKAHSVESKITPSATACVECRTPIAGEGKFCGKCGARLWEPCLGCGEQNSVCDQFCGGCGADLVQQLRRAVEQTEEKLEQAASMAEFGQLREAAQLLEAIELPDHTRLRVYREQIARRSEEYQQSRERISREAGDVLKKVRELKEEVRYQEALELAETIPPALRNAELSALYQGISSQLEHAKTLRQQLQQGIAAKKYEGLLDVAWQLSQLAPHDEKLQQLVGQLQQWQAKADSKRAEAILRQVAQSLAKNAYREADKLLATLPENLEERLEKKYRLAKERIWLAQYLPTAPHADTTLVGAAARLLKLNPEDRQTAQLAQQAAQRLKKGAENPHGLPAIWAKAPESCSLARVIDLCPSPPALVEAARQAERLPAEMMIAYGLALQAAGQAPININLMPSGKSSWREMIKLSGSRSSGLCWGIDIGSQQLRAVCLEPTTKGELPFTIREVVVMPYDAEMAALESSGDGGLSPATAIGLARFAVDRELAGCSVTVNLAAAQTLGRFFQMPAPSASKFAEAVRYEALARIPLKAEDMVHGYYAEELPMEELSVIAETATEDKKGKKGKAKPPRWVMLAGANRRHVNYRIDPFSEVAIRSLQVASSGTALLNAVLADGSPLAQREQTKGGVAVVNLGESTTTAGVMTPQRLWFRGLYLGGESWNGAVAKQLKTDRKIAAQLRQRPEKAPFMYQLAEALQPAYHEVVEQLRRLLDQYRKDTGHTVDRLLLTGSEAHAFGLLHALRTSD